MRQISKHKLFKILSLNSVSAGISLLLGVASTKIVSYFLGASGMALMGSFRNFSAMAKSLSTLGISNSIVTLLVAHRNDRVAIASIYSTLFWLFLALSAVLCGVIFIAAAPISQFLFNDPGFTFPICALGLLLPFMILNVFWMAVYNALEMFRRIILIQIISNIAVFVITAVFIWKKNLTGGLYAIALAELAMTFITFLFVRAEKDYFRFELRRLIDLKYAKVIGTFSIMALISGIVVPLAAILVRNSIIDEVSSVNAGFWDAVQRLSGFYMIFFHTGLSLYYMPKLASINSESGFRSELKSYFKSIVVLAAFALTGVYLLRSVLISLALTPEFIPIENYLHWQIAGDFVRIMTLAFGYQIVVKRMMTSYFVVEVLYNAVYVGLSFYLVGINAEAGALQAYLIANVLCLVWVLLIFRRIFWR